MRPAHFALTVIALIGITQPAPASVIFSDNFNGENGGSGVLNYSGFAQWTVSNGTVDLIGNGFFDFYPGNGLFIDLDGSTSDAGVLTTSMNFAPGTYSLSFFLGGSTRGDTNTVTVMLGDYSESFTLASGDPLAQITRTITTTVPGQLSFSNAGGDNIGAILDNVTVSSVAAVPEPTTMTLFGLMAVGGFAYTRRRKPGAV